MNNDGETRQQVQSVQNGGQRGSVPESDSGTGWIHELFKQQHAMMQEQQQAFMKQQEKLIAEIWQTARLREPVNVEQIGDVLAGQIKDFKFNPDERVTFEGWFSRYEDLFEKDAKKLDDDAKVRLLLRKLGLAEHERYVSHVLPSKPKDFNFEETVEKLKALFGSRESEVSKRYKCLQLRKEKTEDYVVFSCRVNKSVVEAKLAGLSEEQLKCLIYVCGLQDDSDSEIRLRLLSRIEDRRISTLDQLVEECQRLVSLKKDTAMFEKVPHQVNVVNDGKIERFAPKRRSFVKSTAATTKGKLKCCLCGEEHYARKCKYGGYRCNKCHRYGHKEGFCDSAARYASQTKNARIKTVIVNTLGDRQKRHVNVVVNDVPMEFMIDTGADITIISMKEWQRIGSPGLIPASIKAKTASGEQLKIVGEFRAEMKLQQQCKQCIVRVTNEKLMLLGQDAMDVFGLWNIPLSAVCNRVSSQDQFAEFNDIFSNEMGCCKRSKVKLVLKEGAVPVFRPKRPVAYAMLEAVDRELDRLEKEGIISRVDFSAWAAPIVVVRKANGTIRICGDYSTGLNDALQSHHYPIPLPDDIFASLSKSTVFSQIDLSDAFLQVEVEDSSREYLTVNTHRGLYVYNRLPPGVKAAPSAFQQLMETMLTGLKDVAAYLDDIVVGGVDEATHLDNLYAVFRRLRDYGFRIRREKCSFQQKQIKYLGHILDRDGLRPDPAKIDVIVKMPPPKQTSEVRSFLGAVNYYGKFVPQMRNLRYPLDELLKKDGSWQWNSECQRAFDMFKQILRSDLLLTHYDPTKEIIVAADASSVGVGATISHRMSDGSLKVVQHAARALTKAEVNYSQPDREGLAVIYAITKFHRMIFGRKFTLHTDHAPLIRIFGSRTGIPVYTANRLQRWALTLLLYDFKIEYVPTDKFGNADILSRLIAKHERPDEDYVIASIKLEKDMNAMVMQVTGAMPLKFDDVVKATRSDPVLSRVFFYIQEGWPHDKLNDAELRNFQSRSESLSTLRGGIFFGERLVIPRIQREKCLKQLHQGHPGIQRMKALARSYVYWPGLDAEIVELVKSCRHCAAVQKSPPHSAPVAWPISMVPWQRVHVDYAGPIDGIYYLVVIDSCTKWPEIEQTTTTTSSATIRILRGIFARLGMPNVLVSDNGTPFVNAAFEEFCTSNGIEHIRTPPYHPQSNGQAERFVDTFKRTLKKINEGGRNTQEALDLFLLTYRSTPNSQLDQRKSPAEIMFGRRIRTCLELLRVPPIVTPVTNDAQIRRRNYKIGDLVYAKEYQRSKWTWIPGIIRARVGRVIYVVESLTGRRMRLHINQLRSRVDSSHADGTNYREDALRSAITLDILLDSWGNNEELVREKSFSQPKNVIHQPKEMSPLPPCTVSTSSPSSLLSSTRISETLQSPTSPGFATADSGTPSPVQPQRRSSRVRKTPQWMAAYNRF